MALNVVVVSLSTTLDRPKIIYGQKSKILNCNNKHYQWPVKMGFHH